MKYRTILFDADMTLFNFKAAEAIALKQVLEDRGHPATEEVIALYSKINDGLWKAFERGEISRETLLAERFTRLFKELGTGDDGEAANKEYLYNLGSYPILIDGAEELCKVLSKDHDLYIITNGVTETQKRRFASSVIYPYFKGIFVSEETGSQKPHRAYFDYVSSRIPNWSAESTLVVGDSLTADIQGAINYGLDSCWYNPEKLPYTLEQPCTVEIHELKELLNFLKII